MERRKVIGDLGLLDMKADGVSEFIDSLWPEEVTPEEQEELLAELPPADPDAPIAVVTSLRLPYGLKQRVEEAAEADGISASSFIRALRSLPHAT